MNPQLVYFAHQVSGAPKINAERAKRWLGWLLDQEPEVAFVAPWLPPLDVFLARHPGQDDAGHAMRERNMRDALAVAEVCGGIVLCGGHLSRGMRQELDVVVARGGWVSDLTRLGLEPPRLMRTQNALGQLVDVSPLELGRRHWEER